MSQIALLSLHYPKSNPPHSMKSFIDLDHIVQCHVANVKTMSKMPQYIVALVSQIALLSLLHSPTHPHFLWTIHHPTLHPHFKVYFFISNQPNQLFHLKLNCVILILEYDCLSVCLSVTKRPQWLTHYPTADTLSIG